MTTTEASSHPHSEVHIRVNYADVDRMGLLHHAAYLRYFERSREEFARRRGASYGRLEDAGWLMVVVEAELRYRAPARFDEVLAVQLSLTQLRHASLRFEYRVRRVGDHALIAEASTRHAFVDREGRIRRIDDDLRSWLERPEETHRRGEV